MVESDFLARPPKSRLTGKPSYEPGDRCAPRNDILLGHCVTHFARSIAEGPLMNAPMPRPSGFLYSPMYPLGPDQHDMEEAADRRRAHRHLRRPQRAARRAGGAVASWRSRPFTTSRTCCGPGHLAQLRAILDDPEAERERPVRGARPAEERQHRRRRRAADVPGHRHRDRVRQEGPARLGGRRRGGGAEPGACTAPTPRPICAIRRWRRCRCSRR